MRSSQFEPGEGVDRCAAEVVDTALFVHRELGPGFLECVYEEALCLELADRDIPFRRQVPIPIRFKETVVGQGQLDLLVRDCLVVELKSVETLAPVHWAQVRSYLRATDLKLGLLINFNVALLKDGVRRIILSTRTRI